METPSKRELPRVGQLPHWATGGKRPERSAMLSRVSQPLHLDEAIQALRRDPTHPVRVKVDELLTVEIRAIAAAAPAKGTVGEREVGRWEGESGAELDALFTRQRGNRRVPDLP